MKTKLNLLTKCELKFKFGLLPYLKYEYAEIEIETQKLNAEYSKALLEVQRLKRCDPEGAKELENDELKFCGIK